MDPVLEKLIEQAGIEVDAETKAKLEQLAIQIKEYYDRRKCDES